MGSKLRTDGRRAESLRPVTMTPGFLPHAEGSILVESGRTKVICTATVEDRVPGFLRSTGTGWITAEYGMLPRSSPERIPRDGFRSHPSGRTFEVQRLIGRSLRAVTRLERPLAGCCLPCRHPNLPDSGSIGRFWEELPLPTQDTRMGGGRPIHDR